MISSRLEIQAKVRQLGRNPGTYAYQAVESAREQLTGLLRQLKLVMHEAGIMEVNGSPSLSNESLAMWDNVMNEPVPAGPNPLPDSLPDIHAELDQPQIEDQNIPLSSNGNIGPAYGDFVMN